MRQARRIRDTATLSLFAGQDEGGGLAPAPVAGQSTRAVNSIPAPLPEKEQPGIAPHIDPADPAEEPDREPAGDPGGDPVEYPVRHPVRETVRDAVAGVPEEPGQGPANVGLTLVDEFLGDYENIAAPADLMEARYWIALDALDELPLTEEDKAAAKDLWRTDPVGEFMLWISGRTVNAGREFSAASRRVYLSMWNKFVTAVGAEQAATADARTITLFLSGLHGRVRKELRVPGRQATSQRSVRRYLLLLVSVQRHLERLGVRGHNAAAPLLAALGRERSKPLPVALNAVEEAQLRAVLASWPGENWRDQRDRALLELLIGSGIKVSEIQSLTVGDARIEATPPEIIVTSGVYPRKAPLAASSVAPLLQWCTLRVSAGADALLFPGEGHAVLSASTIYRVVASAIKLADLNPFHSGPSVLRHTFAMRQLRAAKPLTVVSTWLGYRDPTSADVYQRMLVDPQGLNPR